MVQRALKSVEEEGIVFLDEIDKIVSPKGSYGPDASSEGVQRDLLPIIEGTTINTKYYACLRHSPSPCSSAVLVSRIYNYTSISFYILLS